MARPKGIPSEKKGRPQPWAEKAAKARRDSGMYERSKGRVLVFKTGKIPWNKGKKWSLEFRTNLSAKLKGRRAWNKGLGLGTPLGIAIRDCDRYKDWRRAVFVRDGYRCVICGELGGRLHADHIKPFALICKENEITSVSQAIECKELWDIENGRALCFPCHKLTDTYSGKVQTLLYKFPRK